MAKRITELSSKVGDMSSSDVFMTDNGTVTSKIDYDALAAAIITQYVSSTLAGSAQSVKAALDSISTQLGKIVYYHDTSFDGAFAAAPTGKFVLLDLDVNISAEDNPSRQNKFYGFSYLNSSRKYGFQIAFTFGSNPRMYMRSWNNSATPGTWMRFATEAIS